MKEMGLYRVQVFGQGGLRYSFKVAADHQFNARDMVRDHLSKQLGVGDMASLNFQAMPLEGTVWT